MSDMHRARIVALPRRRMGVRLSCAVFCVFSDLKLLRPAVRGGRQPSYSISNLLTMGTQAGPRRCCLHALKLLDGLVRYMMNKKLYLVLRFCVRALSATKPGNSIPDASVRIALIPVVLGDEIENFIQIVLYSVQAALWEEVFFNTEHENATLKVSVEIRSDNFYSGFTLASPPEIRAMDKRFFKVTSNFAETLRKELYYYIVNHDKFKALPFPESDSDKGGGQS